MVPEDRRSSRERITVNIDSDRDLDDILESPDDGVEYALQATKDGFDLAKELNE